MRLIGLFIVFAAVIAPIPWFLDLSVKYDIEAVFSQYLGSVALICMGLSQLLATRFKILETIFGGLDTNYVLHKWLGITALSTMMLHDVIDAEMDGLGKVTWIADLAEESGEISLYALMLLIFITLVTLIPYELWKKTHKFVGAFFAMAAFHFLYILKPFSLSDPLGLYLSAFCLIGILSYVYMLVLYGVLRGNTPYLVSDMQTYGDVTELSLAPTKKGLKHKAGQFLFLDLGGEKHPFTIASAPNDDRSVKFFIKALGDYTRGLPSEVKIGTLAHLSPAYGRFLMKPQQKTQVWIAGGIGITPFLAWLEDLKPVTNTQIELYYCVRGEAPFRSKIEAITESQPNVTIHLINSATQSRLSAKQIQQDLKDQFKKASFYFCGPEAMRKNLQEELASLGISKSRLRYEEFEIRSGINFPFLKRIIWNLYRKRYQA